MSQASGTAFLVTLPSQVSYEPFREYGPAKKRMLAMLSRSEEGRVLVLTCSFSSCSPKVEMPPVDARSGVLGLRHTLLSRSQDTLQVRAEGSRDLRGLTA